MGNRTALLIRCSKEEADKIRAEAERERRTVSGYVLNVLARVLTVEESLYAKLYRFQDVNRTLSRIPLRAPGPRTTVLVRCTIEEAKQIRMAAKRRQASISGFISHSLRRFWEVAKGRPTPP